MLKKWTYALGHPGWCLQRFFKLLTSYSEWWDSLWYSPLMRQAPCSLMQVYVLDYLSWASYNLLSRKMAPSHCPQSHIQRQIGILHHGRNYWLTRIQSWIWGLSELAGLCSAVASGLTLGLRCPLSALDPEQCVQRCAPLGLCFSLVDCQCLGTFLLVHHHLCECPKLLTHSLHWIVLQDTSSVCLWHSPNVV